MVKAIYSTLLGFTIELVDTEIQLMVGDWLTIWNLRLMKSELEDQLTPFATMNWVQEASMPFHFQINAVHMLFKTHIGHAGDNNLSSLESHGRILKWAAIDVKKSEYNRGRELIKHSLVTQVINCTRSVIVRCISDLQLMTAQLTSQNGVCKSDAGLETYMSGN